MYLKFFNGISFSFINGGEKGSQESRTITVKYLDITTTGGSCEFR